MWLAFGLLYVLYGIRFFAPGEPLIERGATLWQTAGQIMLQTNLFMPLVGGIVAADRLWRDYRLGVRELQQSAPLSEWSYLIAKYAGVVAGTLTPVVIFVGAVGVISIAGYGAAIEFLPMLGVAMLALSLPAFAFVTIFSLGCPLVMPVRVYQVLFTGYWFWGNFLTPKVIPTLSDTLLTPGGIYAFQGFFGGFVGVQGPLHSSGEAFLNLAVLGVCIIIAFVVLRHFVHWQVQSA